MTVAKKAWVPALAASRLSFAVAGKSGFEKALRARRFSAASAFNLPAA
jgi:hypothetical protein